MLWVLTRPGIKGWQRDKIRCLGPYPLERGYHRLIEALSYMDPPATSRLTVRSFLRWFVRIGTEPHIDVNREGEERKNVLLYARKLGQMTAPTAAFPDDRQRQALKGLQQALSGRASGRPLRVADVQSAQRGLRHRQASTDLKLQPRQHPQSEGQ